MRKFLKIFKMIWLFFCVDKKKLQVDWIEYHSELKSNTPSIVPKKIWIYWQSKDASPLVDLSIQRIRKLHPEFEVKVLNQKTISNYIDVPDFSHLNLPIANISDYIRLALLKKYGGIWIDASTFLTENLDWILSRIHGYDAFLFYSDECTTIKKKPISENWLIVAPENSKFINAWFEEFKKCLLSGNPKLYYSNINPLLLQKLSNPEYLIAYISAIMVLDKQSYPILYARSGSVGHYYNYKYNWDGNLIAVNLLFKDKNKVTVPKLIKFNSSSRKGIEYYLVNKFFLNNSLLGQDFPK